MSLETAGETPHMGTSWADRERKEKGVRKRSHFWEIKPVGKKRGGRGEAWGGTSRKKKSSILGGKNMRRGGVLEEKKPAILFWVSRLAPGEREQGAA